MNDLQDITASGDPESLLEGYLTPEQLARQLGISVRTLSRWHAQRIGPRRITNGRLILYRTDTVRTWLETREGHAAPSQPRLREATR